MFRATFVYKNTKSKHTNEYSSREAAKLDAMELKKSGWKLKRIYKVGRK